MRKKLIITIATVSIVLMLVGSGILIYAGLENDRNIEEITYSDARYERKDAEKTKTIQIDGTEGEKEKILDYSVTDSSGKTTVDIYTDEDQNNYSYNQDGELVRYVDHGESEIDGSVEELTETEAKSLAWKYALQLYGDRVDGFELILYRCSSALMGHEVFFAKTYGADDFVFGARAVVNVNLDGTLGSSSISKEETLLYDASLLQNLTKDQILKKIETDLKLPIGIVEISSARLIYEDDRYVIQVGYSRTDVEYAARETYYYEIPQN